MLVIPSTNYFLKVGFFSVCFLLLPLTVNAQFTITEIHPNPLTSSDKSEWVELKNDSGSDASTLGWNIDGVPLPELNIASEDYVIVAKNVASFIEEFGEFSNLIELQSLSLKNSGDSVLLSNSEPGVSEQREYDSAPSESSWQLQEGDCLVFELTEGLSSPGLKYQDCLVETIYDPMLVEIRITEVMPNPDGSDIDAEWIELFNPTERTVWLNGLEIVNESEVIAEFGDWEGIMPGQYLQVLLHGSVLKNCNGNCEELIELLVNGEVIDSFGYGESQSGASWSLLETGWTEELKPTPAASNSVSKPDSPKTLRFNEVFPSPVPGEVEWVEIENFGAEPISLVGWKLMDAKSEQWLPQYVIPAGGLLGLEARSVTLNNSGDALSLIYDDEQVESLSYPEVTTAQSWAWDGQAWVSSNSPTPGFENIIQQDLVQSAGETAESQQQEEGSMLGVARVENTSGANLIQQEVLAQESKANYDLPSLDYVKTIESPKFETLFVPVLPVFLFAEAVSLLWLLWELGLISSGLRLLEKYL